MRSAVRLVPDRRAPRAYLCSYLLARRIRPGRATYRSGCSRGPGIAFRHHDALEDARACGEVVLAACRLLRVRRGRGPRARRGAADGTGGVYSCASTLPTRSRRGRDGYPAPAPGTDGRCAAARGVYRHAGEHDALRGPPGSSRTKAAGDRHGGRQGGLPRRGTPDPRRLPGTRHELQIPPGRGTTRPRASGSRISPRRISRAGRVRSGERGLQIRRPIPAGAFPMTSRNTRTISGSYCVAALRRVSSTACACVNRPCGKAGPAVIAS
jgi:hypothetical protein